MIMRIADVDPRSDIALSLLRDAAKEVRPLYGETPGPPWPQNAPLGSRDAYIAAFDGEIAVACGAIRELDAVTCEVHRMYVLGTYRRQGLARAILSHLHVEARRLGYTRMRLETGNRQTPAISLYEHYGFSWIEPFGNYVHDPTSVCYELRIDDRSVVPAASQETTCRSDTRDDSP
jgi:GNAT superfamily N-acetyltransferase